jgi:cell division protein FtsQ
VTSSTTRRPTRPHRPPQPVSRDRYRRRRLAAALIALLLVVGLGLTARILLYDVGLADVEDVQVGFRTGDGALLDPGAAAVPVGDVLAAAAVAPGQPLAAVDTAAVAARVAQLPAVASVEVGRSWPHTVTIEVTERIPVARVQTPDGPALVDASGVVYPGGPRAELPRLTFPARSGDPATLAAIAVLTALPDEIRSQVRAVDATVARPGAPAQVTLELTEDRRVRWGDPERAGQKAAVLVPLLTQPGRVYDVSSPDLPTIRR